MATRREREKEEKRALRQEIRELNKALAEETERNRQAEARAEDTARRLNRALAEGTDEDREEVLQYLKSTGTLSYMNKMKET